MSPIIHQRLKTIDLRGLLPYMVHMLLGSFTLPCLQEFRSDGILFLEDLHALVHRSSCPLTRIALTRSSDNWEIVHDLRKIFGVTDLFLEHLEQYQTFAIKEFLLQEYFPDLRHLTLRLEPFLRLWDVGTFSMLVDGDLGDEWRQRKILVIDDDQAPAFNAMWNSSVGVQLKALQNVRLREDGFEIEV
jgi:hypothetical protein